MERSNLYKTLYLSVPKCLLSPPLNAGSFFVLFQYLLSLIMFIMSVSLPLYFLLMTHLGVFLADRRSQSGVAVNERDYQYVLLLQPVVQ